MRNPTDDLEVLAMVLGSTDALLEPRRASKEKCGSWNQSISSRAAVWEARERYYADGLLYLPPDRTALGRQATAAKLAALANAGWLDVRASSGKPARVKLTLEGSRVIRRACGLPTLASSVGLFVRLVQLYRDNSPATAKWKRRSGIVSELALIHPDGAASYGKLPPGAIGTLLCHLAPWMHACYVASQETTYGHAFLEPTDIGNEYYATLDLAAIEPDWELGWKLEWNEVFDSGEMTEEQLDSLRAIFQDTYQRERAALLTATPNNQSELGELPLSATE